MSLTHKRCAGCYEDKPTTEFWKQAKHTDGLASYCKPCANYRRRQWNKVNKDKILVHNRRARTSNPQWSIFQNKKSGAKKKGITFSLVFNDIHWPTHCPILGTELAYISDGSGKPKPNSPSFDRIDPTQGYLPDNVIIVSNKANVIKNNATVDELERVASFYRQLIPHTGASHV